MSLTACIWSFATFAPCAPFNRPVVLPGPPICLNTTQSALSHQVAGIEDQVGMELFVRRSKPMRLTSAGIRMLRVADRILPEIAALEEEFRALTAGKTGRLHIAIQCHACFDWLFPVLELFRHAWPEVDVDIRAGLAFDAFPALLREEVDLVISSNPEPLPGISFNPLFDYHPTFVASSQNPLAQKPVIEPEDFRDQTLITYPVGRDKLDIFTEFLTDAKVEPRSQRPVELTAVILMLVGSNRGVAVLPDWVIRDVRSNADYVTRPLGRRHHHQTPFRRHAGRGRHQAIHGAFPASGAQRAGQAAKDLT